MNRNFAEKLHQTLVDDHQDARLCADISDRACQETPGNFTLILFSYLMTKLGDMIYSPKVSLVWLLSLVGAPAYLIGALVPLRESGSLIPQLFIGSYIRQLPVRKWVWVFGSIAQGMSILVVLWVILNFEGAIAGWLILFLLAVFSLARGFCSVSTKDVIGKTIPKNQRGQLTGWSTAGAGVCTVFLGGIFLYTQQNPDDHTLFLWMIFSAGLMWFVAAMFYSRITEFRGETHGARNAMEALRKLSLLYHDKPFRHFVLIRALLMCSALSAPYYIALAQYELGTDYRLLGMFIIMNGLASLLSAPFWGRFADHSSKKVMITAAYITALLGLMIFFIGLISPALLATVWFLPLCYLILSIAHSGIRIGRNVYVVNLGKGNNRTDYVAISNTVIGVLLLIVGMVGLLTDWIGLIGIIFLLSLMGLAGAILGMNLAELETD